MEEVIPEEEQEPVDLDDIPPVEAPKAIFGDTPICRLLIYLKGKRRLVSWGEIYRNVEPPEGYEWRHVVAAMDRLRMVEAVDEPKVGKFWLNHGPVGDSLQRAMEELTLKHREIHGLKPLVPRVSEGMHFVLGGEGREFYFNGEEMTGDIDRDWWPMRGSE